MQRKINALSKCLPIIPCVCNTTIITSCYPFDTNPLFVLISGNFLRYVPKYYGNDVLYKRVVPVVTVNVLCLIHTGAKGMVNVCLSYRLQ